MNQNRTSGHNVVGRNNRRSQGNNKRVIIGIACAAIVAIVLIIFLNMPKSHLITGTTGNVRSVVNGNTIELNNGLKVILLGVGKTAASQDFLGQLIGKTVQLTADSKDPNQTYKDPMNETVRAYVRVIAPAVNFNCVNGYILRRVSGAQLDRTFCADSLTAYSYNESQDKNKDPHEASTTRGELLDDIALSKLMTPATFFIAVADNQGKGIIGTGFFINKYGLALTSYHVLAGASDFVAFLSDEEGNVTTDRNRKFGRILYSDKNLDFAIFTVALDNGETVPFLPLAKSRPQRGEHVGTVGNPEGLVMTFSGNGQVSALREGYIQLMINATHGNSGGAICNYFGEVVGILSKMSDGGGGTNSKFATDIIEVRKVLANLKDVKEYGGK